MRKLMIPIPAAALAPPAARSRDGHVIGGPRGGPDL